MRPRDEDHSFLHPRIKAIEVPCPCSTVSPRVASILSTGGLTVIYLMWAIGVWKGYFGESFSEFTELFASRDFRSLPTLPLIT